MGKTVYFCSTQKGVCSVCGIKTRGGGRLCYEHRKFVQYGGFTHLRYVKPKRKGGDKNVRKPEGGPS
jgi:hypothetical protein